PQLAAGNARRLEQTGVTPRLAKKGVDVIVGALADEGPLTRRQLAERVEAAGVPTKNQALVHLLMLTALQGQTIRGPMVGIHQAFVLVRDWLGEQPAVDRERALAELARRFLAGHGPADERDLAGWAGLPLRDVRAGLGAIAPELEQRPGGLVDLARRPPTAELPPPKLLGVFEPVLLGWVSREPLLGSDPARIIAGGLFRAFALADGLAAVTRDEPDLVVLDWMLPDIAGIEVGRRMRERGFKTAILFLTAKDAVEDKVEALRAGGDDYVTKPFSLAEIVARIQAVLRRTNGDLPGDVLRFADVTLDESRHEVFRGEVAIDLTATEFNLLRYFMLNPR